MIGTSKTCLVISPLSTRMYLRMVQMDVRTKDSVRSETSSSENGSLSIEICSSVDECFHPTEIRIFCQTHTTNSLDFR